MKYLLAGNESLNRFELMIGFTKIKSVGIIGALRDHLVNGYSFDLAAIKHDVKDQNVKRALATLEAMISIHEKLKEDDWGRIKSLN